MIEAFYRGITFPFKEGTEELPDPAYDNDVVKYSLEQILGTTRGERVMRPAFGCNLYQYVFENNNELLAELLRTEISSAIARWEPRAYLQGVDVTRDENEVTITVSYSVITTGTVDAVEVKVPSPSL